MELTICNWCGGAVDDELGLAMKLFECYDCECARVECDRCGERVLEDEAKRANFTRADGVSPASWDWACSEACRRRLEIYDLGDTHD